MKEQLHAKHKQGLDRLEVWRKKAEEFLASHQTVASCLEAVRNRDTGPRTRIFGLLAIAVHVLGAREVVLNKIKRTYDFSLLPLNPDLYQLHEEQIGAGYWSEAYLLEPKREDLVSLVLKIEFPLKTHSSDTLTETVQRYRDDHYFFRDAYKELPGSVPESNYFVATSPRTQKPAIAILQDFVGHGAFDLLDEKNTERVRELLRTESKFKQDFEAFRRITLDLSEKGRNPDLAGMNNILVVEVGGKHVIRIVDHHSVDADNEIARASERRTLAHLESI